MTSPCANIVSDLPRSRTASVLCRPFELLDVTCHLNPLDVAVVNLGFTRATNRTSDAKGTVLQNATLCCIFKRLRTDGRKQGVGGRRRECFVPNINWGWRSSPGRVLVSLLGRDGGRGQKDSTGSNKIQNSCDFVQR